MEFNQFHPTCLYHSQAKSFLITEAIRGEGGQLLLPNGERFMDRFDKRGELAARYCRPGDRPRNEALGVTVSIWISAINHPSFCCIIFQRSKLAAGTALTSPAINPVVPAATIPVAVLWSIAGAAAILPTFMPLVKLHLPVCMAPTVASNSLLECIVYGQSAPLYCRTTFHRTPTTAAAWDESQVTDSDEDVVISHNWDEVRRFMWDYVGIVRTDKRLQRALRRAKLLQKKLTSTTAITVSNDLIELRNLAMVAELIIRCAIERKESRGLHYTLDYPELWPSYRHHPRPFD